MLVWTSTGQSATFEASVPGSYNPEAQSPSSWVRSRHEWQRMIQAQLTQLGGAVPIMKLLSGGYMVCAGPSYFPVPSPLLSTLYGPIQ